MERLVNCRMQRLGCGLWACFNFTGLWACFNFLIAASQTAKLKFKDSRGQDVDLNIYKGRVLLVVNVASKCGLTDSNYTQLTELYSKYKEHGLEIFAFPCNQFLKQEPGTSQDAQEFACTRYKAEYPIFQKVHCNGPKTAPVYKFLKASKGGLLSPRIKWNFTKFLVDGEGHVVSRYGPSTAPKAIEAHIKRVLGI